MAQPSQHHNLLTVPQVMKRLNVSRRSIYYWIEKGILKPIQVGKLYRFREDDILAFTAKGNGSAHNGAETKKKRILAIDDDILIRESLKMLLEREGYDVRVVSGGQSALDFLAHEDFDLILTDMKMPQMNGLDAVRAIRRLQQRQNKTPVPEVVLTAYDEPWMQEEARALGISSFVHKPFDLEHFLSLIKKLLTTTDQPRVS